MLLFPVMFSAFLGYPLGVRIVISIIYIAGLGVFMGMPFPIGMSIVEKKAKNILAWVWGVNGYATVVGSILSVIISIKLGFNVVLISAALVYAIAFLSLTLSLKE